MQITRKEYENIISNLILETIKIEQQIDDILSNYFCQQNAKSEEFCNYILFNERITFEFKKDIICSILNNNYKSFLKNNPDFIPLISKIPEHRNRFAHLININNMERDVMIENKAKIWSGIDPEIELNNPTIELIIFKRFKNGKPRYVGYRRKDFDIIQINTIKVGGMLHYVKSLIFDYPVPPVE